MARSRSLLAMVCAFAGATAPAAAQDVVQSSWKIKVKSDRPKLVPAPPACLPAAPVCPPAAAVPPVPTMPPATDPKAPPQPLPPIPPAPAAPAPTNLSAALTGAEAGGTAARASALPQVFGDLLGGGTIAGPLPVVVNPNGQYAGTLPIVVNQNGQRQILTGAGRVPPTDELLLGRAAPRAANAQVVGVLPGPGQVFDPSLADFVARVPQVVRGAFKVAENDTPRPTTRAYFTYNFYDQVSRGLGGPDVPRIMLHQEVFGYEQAFAGGLMSVGVRLPYNQLVSPHFLNETSLGDVTLTTKFLLVENTRTGSLLSTGLLVTVPSGNLPFPSTITGQNVRGTLLQPYVGYILTSDSGRAFAQGFSSVIVPTDSNDVTFMANSLDLGYKAVRFDTGRLATIIPVAEFHVNTPLNHRGVGTEPVGFVDSLTVLGGTHFLFRSGAAVGFAVGAPVTGPRPFSLQATFQANFRF